MTFAAQNLLPLPFKKSGNDSPHILFHFGLIRIIIEYQLTQIGANWHNFLARVEPSPEKNIVHGSVVSKLPNEPHLGHKINTNSLSLGDKIHNEKELVCNSQGVSILGCKNSKPALQGFQFAEYGVDTAKELSGKSYQIQNEVGHKFSEQVIKTNDNRFFLNSHVDLTERRVLIVLIMKLWNTFMIKLWGKLRLPKYYKIQDIHGFYTS